MCKIETVGPLRGKAFNIQSFRGFRVEGLRLQRFIGFWVQV